MTYDTECGTKNHNSGFTIVEVLVTILVAVAFIGIMLGIYSHIFSVNANIKAHYIANMAAYNNMRRYANNRAPIWFQCNYSAGSSTPDIMTLLDSTEEINGLHGDVRQIITASAPYGCNTNSTTGFPIKITSTVTYGFSGRSVTHATYASY